MAPARRVVRLERMLAAAGRLDEQPSRRAEVAYLLGCHYADAADFYQAARMFECAFHDDDAYVTASVLVFACLRQQVAPDGDFLNQAVQSWRELRQPRLLGQRRERQLLRVADSPTRARTRPRELVIDALGQVPIRLLRRRIEPCREAADANGST